MSDLINELINDEAVYRTAPATPGLLNTYYCTDLKQKNTSLLPKHCTNYKQS